MVKVHILECKVHRDRLRQFDRLMLMMNRPS